MWMVPCKFLSMKARTRAICQPANPPIPASLAPERRSISDLKWMTLLPAMPSRPPDRDRNLVRRLKKLNQAVG